jgi:hypothetical protein
MWCSALWWRRCRIHRYVAALKCDTLKGGRGLRQPQLCTKLYDLSTQNVFCLHRKIDSFLTLPLILSFPSENICCDISSEGFLLFKKNAWYPQRVILPIQSDTTARCRMKWPFRALFLKFELPCPGVATHWGLQYIGRLALFKLKQI